MDPERDYQVIAIDFDNTLFITEYPKIIAPISPIIERAKKHKEGGDKLILWTCREGPELDAAVGACLGFGLEFDAVNDNLPELKEKWGNNPRKIAADEYWDDHNILVTLLKDFDKDGADISWTAPGLGYLDDLALMNMPLWAAKWVVDFGGLLDWEVVSAYIRPRLSNWPDGDLEDFRKYLILGYSGFFINSLPDEEDWIMAKDMEKLADEIKEELENRRKHEHQN